MSSELAVPGPNGRPKKKSGLDRHQRIAVELYSRGYRRPEVARALVRRMFPDTTRETKAENLKKMRARLRHWEKNKEFRDALWSNVVNAVDMDTARILEGVMRKARAGRVDAAKFALEIAGRYTPHGEANIAVPIQVNFEGLPRPNRFELPGTQEIVDGEVVEEDEE